MSSAPRGDGSKRSGGVKYDTLMDKRVDDERHERQKSNKESINKGSVATVSSTFDAFQRMAAGLEPRTLADNMSNPNRPTWEQYKKDNGDKLDLVGTDMRKMAAYRAQLDRERDERLSGSKRKVSAATSDDDSDNEAEKKKSKKKKSKKEHKKNSKKEKKKSNKVFCSVLSMNNYSP